MVRHRLAGQALGRGQAGVARNHHTLAVHEDRVGKPELLDRRRNLVHLRNTVGPALRAYGTSASTARCLIRRFPAIFGSDPRSEFRGFVHK